MKTLFLGGASIRASFVPASMLAVSPPGRAEWTCHLSTICCLTLTLRCSPPRLAATQLARSSVLNRLICTGGTLTRVEARFAGAPIF